MSIKEIINEYKWNDDLFTFLRYEGVLLSTHNASIDRIAAFVMNTYLVETCAWCGKKFVKLPDHPHKDGLSRCPHCMAEGVDVRQQRIDELEARITKLEAGESAWKFIATAKDARVPQLQAQVPNTVTPDKADKGPHALFGGRCECSHLLIGGEKFCSECGSKLDWEK